MSCKPNLNAEALGTMCEISSVFPLNFDVSFHPKCCISAATLLLCQCPPKTRQTFKIASKMSQHFKKFEIKAKFLKLRPPLLYLSKCSYIATRTVRGEVCSDIFCCHFSCTLGLWMWGRGSAAAFPSCLWAKAGLDKSPVYHRATSHSYLQAIWSSQFASHS